MEPLHPHLVGLEPDSRDVLPVAGETAHTLSNRGAKYKNEVVNIFGQAMNELTPTDFMVLLNDLKECGDEFYFDAANRMVYGDTPEQLAWRAIHQPELPALNFVLLT